MIKVDLTNIQSFLRLPYEAALSPRLKIAHSHLQLGDGTGGEFTGWVHLPRDYDRAEYDRIKAAAKKIQSDSQALVVIGIGGSYLGARGVIECLCSPNYNLKKKDTPNIYFMGNGLSSEALTEVMELVKDVDFSVNVISKSGTTTEPAVAFRIVKEHIEKNYTDASERIVAITDAHKGALKTLSTQEGYKTFVVPDNVGGRFSVLTPVGLLPIVLAGFDVREMLAGAAEMEKALAVKGEENPAVQYAAMRNLLYSKLGKKVEILVAYNPKFQYLGEWWKQLYGESEGKDLKGIFPASVNFTTDLHSMGQFIQDGDRVVFETVVNIEKSNREVVIGSDEQNLDQLNYLAGQHVEHCNAMAQLGTKLAHIDGGVPQLEVSIEKINAFNLGGLFYFFEYACGVSAYVLGVNPFNQPGVEAYKKNMFALLGKPGYEEQGKALQARL